MERIIAFRYRNGYECVHKPTVDSDDDWWEMIRDLTVDMNQPNPGIFITKSPFGIHKLADVEAVHFGDATPPENSPVPQIGFIKG